MDPINTIGNLLTSIAALLLILGLPLVILYLQAKPTYLTIQENYGTILKISYHKKDLEIMKRQRFLLIYQSTSKSTSLKIRNIDTSSANNELHFSTPFPKKNLLKKI